MRIMGIDPGLNATGYGVIADRPGRLQFIAAGVIRPPAKQPLADRLLHLYEALEQAIGTYQPTTIVLESLYTHHQYQTTATLMAHARGVACLLSAQRHLELVDYAPTRVKKALTGNGSASKEQVAHLVGVWLQHDDPTWSSDATDALALAIVHAHIRSGVLGSHASGRRQRRWPDALVGSGGTRR